MDEFHNSQEDIARIIGKSRSHVANTLRLLKLSDTIKAYIANGKLSAGHARTLIGKPNADELAEQIVARGLNVRQVEALTREKPKRGTIIKNGRVVRGIPSADTLALQKRLGDALGLSVLIDEGPTGGTVSIRYRTLEQLDDVVRRLDGKH